MDAPAKIGRYEIVEEKGRGAMGAVYIARDPAMDRVVALKTIHSLALSGPQGTEYRERFYREARAAGRLAHPGIVPMFDVGEQDGLPYMVMEYIEGHTLADGAKSGSRFTLERVIEIGQQIAEALGYAHKHGVIHRDIKPANILLTSQEKYGIERPKITDFGVAKVSASHITTTGQMLGTPAFMPPEQFTGALIDGRSDIFSLGVILYWLATGEQAFPGETVTAVSYKVVHTEPVPPRKLNPAVPGALERVILKCLTKDPGERYQTGEDLARDLAAIRAGRNPNELKTMVTVTDAPGSDSGMDVTLDSNPLETQQASPTHKTEPAAQRTGSTAQPMPKRRGGVPMVGIAAGILIVVVALGWYWHRRTVAVASTTAHPQDLSVSVPVAKPANDDSSVPEVKTPPANPERVSETTSTKPASNSPERPPVRKTPATEKRSNANAVPTVKAVTPPPAVPDTKPAVVAPPVEAPQPAPPAHVNFNPLSLDPAANAKLRVEADHFPVNVEFTIEMNGKIYFERSANKTQTEFDNLFVPPGIQEFRFVAGSGTNRKTSNTVSVEFKAKKRKTLRIELREPVGNGVPQNVYPDSQLVAVLK